MSDSNFFYTECIRLYLQCRKIHGPMAPLHHPGPKIMARVVEMNAISWPEMLKRMLFHGPVKKLGVQSNACTEKVVSTEDRVYHIQYNMKFSFTLNFA